MNVFLITAPFQILNAIEAIHHFNIKNNDLIILKVLSFNESHYEKLIDKDHWTSVKYVDFHHRAVGYDFGEVRPRNFYESILELYLTFDQFLKRTRLDRMAKSLGSVDNLVLGSYRSDYDLHFRHFANRVNCKNIYVLDVGTNTIDFERQSEGNKVSPVIHQISKGGFVKRIRRTLRHRLVDWDSYGLKRVTFFTCYDCDGNENSRVEKNEYKYLKSLMCTSSISNRVLFLGESLVVDGLVSFNVYLEHLTRIKAYFRDKDLVYVPHPRELDEYVQIIRKELGFEIERYEVPIEYALATGGKKPKCVASFLSSALQNCSIIFGNSLQIKAFYLGDKDLLKGRDMVARIYSHFRSKNSENIEVIVSY